MDVIQQHSHNPYYDQGTCPISSVVFSPFYVHLMIFDVYFRLQILRDPGQSAVADPVSVLLLPCHAFDRYSSSSVRLERHSCECCKQADLFGSLVCEDISKENQKELIL